MQSEYQIRCSPRYGQLIRYLLFRRMYQQPAFLDQLMVLLRDELATPGWATLPRNLPSTVIQVQRISGALTNAVFFVSIPDVKVELAVEASVASPESYFDQMGDPDQDVDADVSPRALPATVFSELERGRAAASTPRPREVRLEPAAAAAAGSSTLSTPQVVRISLPGSMPDEPAPDADSGESSPAEPASPSGGAGTSRVRIESTTLSAPTILLRVYGPQSGSLISRRTELHILHTLSSQYGIGAHVLGTFANGRVEEYFHSRALVKEEMRDPRVSRWIGRRMRELHSVDLQQIIPPPTEEEMARDEEKRRRTREKLAAAGGAGARPGPDPLVHTRHSREGSASAKSPMSTASAYSTSSASSVFSFGTTSSSSSVYSNSSVASNATINSGSARSLYGSAPTSLHSSPDLLPRRTPSEVSVGDRKRPRQRGSSSRGRQWRAADKLCVWENITCWTRQAKNVLRELDELAQLPGFAKLFSTASSASTPSGPGGPTTITATTTEGEEHVTPLASPARTFAIRSMLNIPLFEQQVRLYRQYVHRAERAIGKSKRVFAHNDTQYGNLLLVTPTHGTPEEEEEIERTARREGGAHRRIVVIDFEYAGANPRGFDIGESLLVFLVRVLRDVSLTKPMCATTDSQSLLRMASRLPSPFAFALAFVSSTVPECERKGAVPPRLRRLRPGLRRSCARRPGRSSRRERRRPRQAPPRRDPDLGTEQSRHVGRVGHRPSQRRLARSDPDVERARGARSSLGDSGHWTSVAFVAPLGGVAPSRTDHPDGGVASTSLTC